MKKRYAVCGVSGRALAMWIPPIYKKFSKEAELVALLDIDPKRFEVAGKVVPETAGLPGYLPEEFDKMLKETRPDVLIVTGVDATHAQYILKGLENDLDIVAEKPMTTNWEDAVRIRQAEKNSKGRVICTFNYRYTPVTRMLREMLIEKKVGKVTNIDLTWYIDIHHGASYFNRWNRMRENSGSLSIHKSSHHFDLMNWLVDGIPETVHAMGALNFYGPDAPFNPSKKDGRHCKSCAEADRCAYHRRWNSRSTSAEIQDDHLSTMELADNCYTNYSPDMCIFDSEINIFDTFIANIRYNNGVLLNYSANFSTPYEGYRLAINGTHGRIETECWGGAGATGFPSPASEQQYVDYFPIFGSKQRFWAVKAVGGHGGGDPLIQEDVFMGVDPLRPYKILADSFDGLAAIAIGDAVFKSIKSGEIIDLRPVMAN